MNEKSDPGLAPPGAGLPKVELFVARLLSRWRVWTGSRESFTAGFQRERVAISRLYRACDAPTAARRFLIKRLPGMEDSSRNWSVWMTLDHLRIVNHGIANTIDKLAKEIVPEGTASTEAVKPAPSANASVVAEYEASCDAVLAAVAAAPNLRTRARFAHPWFGPLDVFAWHGLAGNHMTIHRKQLERIVDGLRKSAG
jgi:uncharacterized damage-inducible protein DinB